MLTDELNNCYGCTACSQKCPAKAISMQASDEGFLYPKIDLVKCINCDLCKRVCPVSMQNLNKILHQDSNYAYAAWNKSLNKIQESTSGGLFGVLAERILSIGGVIYGCAWKDEELTAHHTRIASTDALIKLKGSKYVQSHIENTYIQTESDLRQNKIVLFSGTPCQIAGLRLFLRKEYDGLYTIDLVCHGVPSPLMFDEYIKWLRSRRLAEISDFKFRDKKVNDHRAYISWIENSKIKKMCLTGLQPYSFGFYHSYFSRMSCYECSFSTSRRVGDVTLSDFWGGEKHHPELLKARQHGFNLLLCNTKKGERLFDSIKEEINYLPTKLEYAVMGDIRLRQSEEKPQLRNVIYKELQDKGFDFIARNYLRQNFYYLHKVMPIWLKSFIKNLKNITSSLNQKY